MLDEKELDSLLNELERMSNGATVHTINKAKSYLESFAKKGTWFLKDEDERKRFLVSHVKQCREAVRLQDTTLLELSMRRWF